MAKRRTHRKKASSSVGGIVITVHKTMRRRK